MVERGSGVIVNVASMAGKVPLKGCSYYGASKAGLAMASEIARADLAPYGVRVVTVYPGPVKSALEQGAREAYSGNGLFKRYAPTGDPIELVGRLSNDRSHSSPPRPKSTHIRFVLEVRTTVRTFSSWTTSMRGRPRGPEECEDQMPAAQVTATIR